MRKSGGGIVGFGFCGVNGRCKTPVKGGVGGEAPREEGGIGGIPPKPRGWVGKEHLRAKQATRGVASEQMRPTHAPPVRKSFCDAGGSAGFLAGLPAASPASFRHARRL